MYLVEARDACTLVPLRGKVAFNECGLPMLEGSLLEGVGTCLLDAALLFLPGACKCVLDVEPLPSCRPVPPVQGFALHPAAFLGPPSSVLVHFWLSFDPCTISSLFACSLRPRAYNGPTMCFWLMLGFLCADNSSFCMPCSDLHLPFHLALRPLLAILLHIFVLACQV